MHLCHVNCQWVHWRAGFPCATPSLPCSSPFSLRWTKGSWKRKCCHPHWSLLWKMGKVQLQPLNVRMFWRFEGERWIDTNTRNCLNGLSSYVGECWRAEGEKSRCVLKHCTYSMYCLCSPDLWSKFTVFFGVFRNGLRRIWRGFGDEQDWRRLQRGGLHLRFSLNSMETNGTEETQVTSSQCTVCNLFN